MEESLIARIVLTGFMGAGKTTVGVLLARALSWDFVDTDQLLTEDQGASIAELFARGGEAEFRELEAAAVARLLEREHIVIALGGGAIEALATRERLFQAPRTHVVFLETPLEVALARCRQQTDGAVRPLIVDREAELAERFARRAPHYRAAHQTFSTDRPPEELLRLLLAELPPPLAPPERKSSFSRTPRESE